LEATTEGQFYGPNLGYVLELYDKYREDPGSVDERTREFFERWRPPRPGANGHAAAATAEVRGVDVDKVVGAAKFVRSIRDFGHTAARLDPLGSDPPGDPTLDAGFHGIVEEDLEALPSSVIGGPIAERTSSAKDAVDELRRVYCETTGYDFGHIHVPEERFWLRDAVESDLFEKVL
jgi:2-oxoglutarate dehydrogenase E1 component